MAEPPYAAGSNSCNGGGGRNPAPSPLPAPAIMEAKRRSANMIGRYGRVRRSGNALRPLLGRQRCPCHAPRLLRRMEAPPLPRASASPSDGSQVLKPGFDDNFIRIWEFYLIYSTAGFKSRAVGHHRGARYYSHGWLYRRRRAFKL